MAEENAQPVAFNSVQPGTYEAVIRTGEALPVYDPNPIREAGIITAPANFYETRKKLLVGDEAPFKPYFTPMTTFVKVNRKAGEITLFWDEYSHFRQYVTGRLQMSEYYEALGINDYSKLRSPNELSTLLKRHRFLFSDTEKGMQIIADLAKFKATINSQVENEKDERGGKKNLLDVSVKTNIPVDFELTLQPFKGFEPVKFMVSICLETQGQSVVCYLESIQALEYFEAQKEKIFDEQLKVFAADGIAIIEQ